MGEPEGVNGRARGRCGLHHHDQCGLPGVGAAARLCGFLATLPDLPRILEAEDHLFLRPKDSGEILAGVEAVADEIWE
jgi:hypothetical protein